MIQFNLLPDIKQEYIRAQRTRRLISVISVLVTAAAIALCVILVVGVNLVEKHHLSNLNQNIQQDTAKIKSIPHINDILTVQNQLNSLEQLHNSKPAAKRLYSYLNSMTPANADISELDIDFTQNTMQITGTASNLNLVKQFVDTLKHTQYQIEGQSNSKVNAFSQVVLSSFGTSDNRASYTINLDFDPTIFNNTDNIKLDVPQDQASHANTVNSSDLFKAKPKGRQ